MRCLCPTTNTLRLFIRSITHVDAIASASTQAFRGQTSIRSFTLNQTRPQADETAGRAIQSRRISFDKNSAETQYKTTETEQWPQGSTVREDRHARGDAGEIAFAELTPESIEAIAQESKSQTSFQDRTVREVEFKTSSWKNRHFPDTPLKTTFRRTKVQNTSLSIHFSAPRAPLNTRQTTHRDPKESPKLDSRSNSDLLSWPNSRSVLAKAREKPLDDEDWKPPAREHWQTDKAALKAKFPGGWNPQKRLSPDALAGIRALHAQIPEQYTTSSLAESFQVSPDAIRRILKSKWSPDAEEETDRQRRWLNRGKKIYAIHADQGQKPPKKWRQMGIGDGKPDWMLRKEARARAPLPALITTTRRREQRELELEDESKSRVDRILG